MTIDKKNIGSWALDSMRKSILKVFKIHKGVLNHDIARLDR